MKSCIVKGCTAAYYAKDFCEKHWARWRKHGSPADSDRTHALPEVRFWRHVTKGSATECWPFRRKGKYARFQIGGKGSAHVSAHRYSYQLAHGEIPCGMIVMHKCDNPKCVNPAHLTVGTYRDNTHDMIEKGRKRTVAPRGRENGKAKLTPEAVRIIRQSKLRRDILAKHLGVSVSAIRDVRSGRSWSHIS
jgi:DNA-binding transcriptional regulator YiaG